MTALQVVRLLQPGKQEIFLDAATVAAGEPVDRLMPAWNSWHGSAASSWLAELQQCDMVQDSDTLVTDPAMALLAQHMLQDKSSRHCGSRLWLERPRAAVHRGGAFAGAHGTVSQGKYHSNCQLRTGRTIAWQALQSNHEQLQFVVCSQLVLYIRKPSTDLQQAWCRFYAAMQLHLLSVERRRQSSYRAMLLLTDRLPPCQSKAC
jgi:hypothetical protein